MAPTESASDNPGGNIYDLETQYESRLPSRFHGSFFILEAKEGNVLTREVLNELYQNSQALRDADVAGELHPPSLPKQSYLYNGFDVDREEPIFGIYSLADSIAQVIDIEKTDSPIVDESVKKVLSDPKMEGIKDLLYGLDYRKDNDTWSAPAMGIFVAGDNEKLGGGSFTIGSSNPIAYNKEYFSRKVEALLQGNQEYYRLWGVAIDAALETDDEVGTAIPFIMATVIIVLLIVGISLRSAKSVLLTAIGLAFMMIWLKGLSNLIGLKSSTTLDFIVPIAMISLGADFVIHAVNRYREEGRLVSDPRRAFRNAIAGVIGALTLAMATDAIAFLANITANIETVIGFGIGAGLAIFSAFVIMGLAIPTAMMRIDSWRLSKSSSKDAPSQKLYPKSNRKWTLPRLIVLFAQQRLIVLTFTAALTIIAGIFAFQLEATFDVKDFFKRDSSFVIGLDKMDYYVGDSGGENAIVYIEGDLTNPESLQAISNFVTKLNDNPYIAKRNGEVNIQSPRTIFHIVDQVMRSEYTISSIEESSGIPIHDDAQLNEFHYQNKIYLWPNSKEKLTAIYEYISLNGVKESQYKNIYDNLQIGETFSYSGSKFETDATALTFGIPGTRNQTVVIESQKSLNNELTSLQNIPSLTLVGLTGSPYTRQSSLDATTDGLQNALVVAVIACMAVVIMAMRSIRFGIVTVLPIGIVVAWLYAFMYIFGFGLNFVTATIAAVSIGVGIDYAVHMTIRFREELSRNPNRTEALHKAAAGTGLALFASAATSIMGFAVMGFAPMPLFSSYGILTAVMIFMAAVASMFVLPALLFLVTSEYKSSD